MKMPGPYVPLDVNYDSDPAIIAAGEDAEVLFVRSLSYSKRSYSDGFVPDFQLPRFGLKRIGERVAALVREGVWLPVDGGFQIRSWARWNETSVEMEQKRQRNKERQQAKRDREARDGGRDDAVTTTDVTPASQRDDLVSHTDKTRQDRERQDNHSVGDAAASPSQRDDADGIGPNPSTAMVVAAWVDGAREHTGERPAARLIAQVGRQARELLAEGRNPERLADAALACGRKGYADLGRELLKPGAANGNGRAAGADVLDQAQAHLDARSLP